MQSWKFPLSLYILGVFGHVQLGQEALPQFWERFSFIPPSFDFPPLDCEILCARNVSGQLEGKGYLRLKEWLMWGHMDTRGTSRRLSWQKPERQVWGRAMPGRS